MLAALIFAGVVSTLSLDGEVVDDGTDYKVIELEVPEGVVEIGVEHVNLGTGDILDWGLWGPDGFRGWGGGLTEAAGVGETSSTRGYLPGPITAGTWTVVIGKAKIETYPAPYSLTVTLYDAETLAPEERAPYSALVVANGPSWFAGDFHVHSRESGDATATFDEIAALMRERGLQFAAISDHNTVAQHGLLARYAEDNDDLLFLRAAEITTYAGHANGIGITDYVDHRVGLDGRSAADIVADVKGQNAVFSVNHPALDLGTLCIGCAWKHADTPWADVDAIEIHTGAFEQVVGIFTPAAIALWDEQLDAGYRITALGGSDDHRAGMDTSANASPIGSPTTLIYADELSEAGILDGIRQGRAVVKLRGPDDPMVELFAIAPDGTRGMIGDTVTGATADIEVHVTGGSGLEVILVRNGVLGELAAIDSDDWTHTFPVEISEAGDRYRAHVVLGALPVVVTNHVYVEYAPPEDGGGCGCSVGGRGARASWLVALCALALIFAARSRARR